MKQFTLKHKIGAPVYGIVPLSNAQKHYKIYKGTVKNITIEKIVSYSLDVGSRHIITIKEEHIFADKQELFNVLDEML